MGRTITYRGCACTETGTTTAVRKRVFGHVIRRIAYVWRVEGRYSKDARVRPFLASAADCRAYIRKMDELLQPRER